MWILRKRNVFGKVKMTRKEKGKRERKKKEITKNCLPLFSDMVIPKMFRCQMQALLFRHIINVTALILKRFYSNSRFFLWQNIERIGYFLLYTLVFFHTSRFKVDPGTTQNLIQSESRKWPCFVTFNLQFYAT